MPYSVVSGQASFDCGNFEAVHGQGGFVIAEDERNLAELLREREKGGRGLDAVWSDDLHHQVRVALTGERHSYFGSYEGTSAALADVLEHGPADFSRPNVSILERPKPGDASKHRPTTKSFVVCIENHDQVGNRACGERLEHMISARKFRAATLFLCLSPYVPMLFMGQEWAASSPFLFFTDFDEEHGKRVSEGRRSEFGHIGLVENNSSEFPDPQDPAVFVKYKLIWAERTHGIHRHVLELNSEALAIRKVMSLAGSFERGQWRVEHWGPVIVLRYALVSEQALVLISFEEGMHPLQTDAEFYKQVAALSGNLDSTAVSIWR